MALFFLDWIEHQPVDNSRVRVGDSAMKANGGRGHLYVRSSRPEGSRAAAVLTRACGFLTKVAAALVFVFVADIVVAQSLGDEKMIRGREMPSFRRQAGVLGLEEIGFVPAVARAIEPGSAHVRSGRALASRARPDTVTREACFC